MTSSSSTSRRPEPSRLEADRVHRDDAVLMRLAGFRFGVDELQLDERQRRRVAVLQVLEQRRPNGFPPASVATTWPSCSITKPARPLSRSASASQVSLSPRTRRFVGAGGGVESLVALSLVYCIHASDRLVRQPDRLSARSPLKSAAANAPGSADLRQPRRILRHFPQGLAGLFRQLGRSGTLEPGMARWCRWSPHSWLVSGSTAMPITALMRAAY